MMQNKEIKTKEASCKSVHCLKCTLCEAVNFEEKRNLRRNDVAQINPNYSIEALRRYACPK